MKIDPTLATPFTDHLKTISPVEQTPNTFAVFLTDAINTTNTKLIAADDALQQLASGHANSLHQTMLTMEEAKLSFQCLEQIRNRLMMAYQDILREQI